MNNKLNIYECYLFQEDYLINSFIQYICNSNNNKKLIKFTYNNNDKMNNFYISNTILLYEYFVLDKLYQNNDSSKSFLCYEKILKSLNTSK